MLIGLRRLKGPHTGENSRGRIPVSKSFGDRDALGDDLYRGSEMFESVVGQIGWSYVTEEGKTYNGCLPYRRIYPATALWMSAFPIKKAVCLLGKAMTTQLERSA